ncbi:MAG: hypothetical protein JNK77_03940 [Saprospiraceae bacterium]|nr:hypothetical protein [Saprospiraceae bacterium]
MKQTLILIFLFLFGLNAKADYGYMSLSALVCEADFGAIGTIVKLDKSYFYLKVEKYVLSKLEFDTLKIQKFESWSCGQRYGKYEVGQKELVFFRKSNYVIDDYDLLGYGAGGEFELPIKGDSIFYNYSYGKLKSYSLNEFLYALKDFNSLKQNTKETSISINKEEQDLFSSKSNLHKLFIECRKRNYEGEFEVPTNGFISNLEKSHLYQDYENKVYVYGFNMDSIYLSVDDAEVWKTETYFIVKPKDAWTRRWLNVYSTNDKNKSKVLYNQLFEILELPEPRIYFGSYYRDTIYGSYEAIPRTAHYLDDMHEDEFLKYELLSYSYTIMSNNSKETFKVKSSRGTLELHDRLRKMNPGDQINISDVYVLYPNQTVRQIKGRTVIVGNRQ